MSSQDEEETRFLAKLVERDESAFNTLVVRYERRIYAFVFRMTGNPSEAEDLAQEVFVQVFRAIDTFRGESKLSTWLFRIAANLCKNRAKYLSRRPSSDGEEFGENLAFAQAKGVSVGDVARPDEVVEGLEVEQIVKRAILRLEPDFREALILRDVEDLTYDEIGAIVGAPEGTVKSRIFRARSQLKELVEAELGEPIGRRT